MSDFFFTWCEWKQLFLRQLRRTGRNQGTNDSCKTLIKEENRKRTNNRNNMEKEPTTMHAKHTDYTSTADVYWPWAFLTSKLHKERFVFELASAPHRFR